jgi:UPF0271 protein
LEAAEVSIVTSIDLNCDMGESFGPWKMGQDSDMMPHITSANIACGAHAGDPDVMAATVRLAVDHSVAIGAHPGYPDLRWFGRRPMRLTHAEVVNLLLYQLGALWAVVRAAGAELHHVKPHGALYNQACEDASLAGAVAEGVSRFSRSLYLVGLPNSALARAADESGLSFLSEGFADRRYEPNGSLRDRRYADSLLTDPEEAASQALSLALGSVLTHGGASLDLRVDTLCIHGDTPGAPQIAQKVRARLQAGGIMVAPVAAKTPPVA